MLQTLPVGTNTVSTQCCSGYQIHVVYYGIQCKQYHKQWVRLLHWLSDARSTGTTRCKHWVSGCSGVVIRCKKYHKQWVSLSDRDARSTGTTPGVNLGSVVIRCKKYRYQQVQTLGQCCSVTWEVSESSVPSVHQTLGARSQRPCPMQLNIGTEPSVITCCWLEPTCLALLRACTISPDKCVVQRDRGNLVIGTKWVKEKIFSHLSNVNSSHDLNCTYALRSIYAHTSPSKGVHLPTKNDTAAEWSWKCGIKSMQWTVNSKTRFLTFIKIGTCQDDFWL